MNLWIAGILGSPKFCPLFRGEKWGTNRTLIPKNTPPLLEGIRYWEVFVKGGFTVHKCMDHGEVKLWLLNYNYDTLTLANYNCLAVLTQKYPMFKVHIEPAKKNTRKFDHDKNIWQHCLTYLDILVSWQCQCHHCLNIIIDSNIGIHELQE